VLDVFGNRVLTKTYLCLRERDAGGWRNLTKRIFLLFYTSCYLTDMIKKYGIGWNRRMRGENEKLRGYGLKIVKGATWKA